MRETKDMTWNRLGKCDRLKLLKVVCPDVSLTAKKKVSTLPWIALFPITQMRLSQLDWYPVLVPWECKP